MDNIVSLINDNKWREAYKKLDDKNKYLIDGNAILHIACNRGQKDIIKYLVDRKDVNIYLANNSGDTCLHLLIKNSFDDIAKKIIDKYPDLLAKINESGAVPVHYLIDRKDNRKFIIFMIKKMIKYNYLDALNLIRDTGTNVLIDIINISDGAYFKLFKLMVESGCRLDIPTTNPPLHASIRSGNMKCAEFLINYDSTENICELRDQAFFKPINCAVASNNTGILELLLNKDIDLNYGAGENDFIPLNVAINNKLYECAELLLKYDVDVNRVDRYRNIPLHYAIYNEAKGIKIPTSIVTTLIQRSDLNSMNVAKVTPLQIMFKSGLWKKYIDSLKDRNMDIYINDKSKRSIMNYIDDKDIPMLMNLLENNRTQTPIKIDLSEVDSPISTKIDKKLPFGLFNSDIVHSAIYTLYSLRLCKEISIPMINDGSKRKASLIMLNLQRFIIDPIHSLLYDMIEWYYAYLYPISPYVIIWRNKNHYYKHPMFLDLLRRCYDRGKRFILIKITLLPNELGTHANLVIYDRKDNSVRRFEPYGVTDILDGDALDEMILNVFTKITKKKIIYYKPADYLNRGIYQTLSLDSDPEEKHLGDPLGYCLAWCIWYTELKTTQPDKSEKDLIEDSISHILSKYSSSKNSMLDYIRDYARNLDDKKNEILEEFNIPEQYWYDTSYKNIDLVGLSRMITDKIEETLAKNNY